MTLTGLQHQTHPSSTPSPVGRGAAVTTTQIMLQTLRAVRADLKTEGMQHGRTTAAGLEIVVENVILALGTGVNVEKLVNR